jgi:hypothetical protein
MIEGEFKTRLVSEPVATPEKTGVLIVGEVNVLFVNVSVVALPTNVSGPAGNVNAPTLPDKDGFVIVGEVNVLPVNV